MPRNDSAGGVVWLQKDDGQDDEDDDGDYKQDGVGVVHDLLLSRIISGHTFSLFSVVLTTLDLVHLRAFSMPDSASQDGRGVIF